MNGQFTSEMYDKLHMAKESVKGKPYEYMKYDMEIDSKNINGKWIYIGHGIPYIANGVIKSYKDNTYIIVADGMGDYYRYLVNDEVKQLLNI